MIMVNTFPTSQLNSTPAVLSLAQLSRSLYFHLLTLVELDKFEQTTVSETLRKMIKPICFSLN